MSSWKVNALEFLSVKIFEVDGGGYTCQLILSSIPAVTSFFSMCRCRDCSRNLRKSAAWALPSNGAKKLCTDARNIFPASSRDSTDISDEASRLSSAHINPSLNA